MSNANATYDYWRTALKALREGEPMPSIQENSPQFGFYRRRYPGKDGPWMPAAIFPDRLTGEVCLAFDKKKSGHEYAAEHWTWLAKNPITEEVYRSYDFVNNRWPDEATAEVKSNLPADPAERIKVLLLDRVEAIRDFVKAVPKIETQEQCDRASNLAAPTVKLLKEADDLRKKLKKPHDDAAEAIQAQFAYCKDISVLAKKLKDMAADYADREDKRRKAEALRLQREEQARLDAERKALENQDITLAASMPREIAKLPEVGKVQSGGLTGKKQGFKTVYDIEVIDIDALVECLKGNEEMKSLAIEIARRMVRKFSGKPPIQLNGIEIVDRKAAA